MNTSAGRSFGFRPSPHCGSGEAGHSPVPGSPSASIAGRTMQESVYSPRAERHLPEDAPNILIVIIDDVGPGSGKHLWRLDQYADAGSHRRGRHRIQLLSHDRDVLTHPRGPADGRNHHRVASGQIAELANDWDGYSGLFRKAAPLWPRC